MFGFLSPVSQNNEYRAIYSRCCQHQRHQYSLRTLPFLSYEAVFLYHFWLDATDASTSVLANQRCCKLQSIDNPEASFDFEIGRFCSALSMLLASTKIEDDVRDGISLRMRIARAVIGKQVGKGREYFSSMDLNFSKNIDHYILTHLQMERANKVMVIEDYAEPTALAFGYVFSLLHRLPELDSHKEVLTQIGKHVGAAIIAFDCAVDWQQDRQKGQFNPLPNQVAVDSAMNFSKQQLVKAAELCRMSFGDSSLTYNLLQGVRESLEPTALVACSPTTFSIPFRPIQALALLMAESSTVWAQEAGKKNDGNACVGCCCLLVCCAIASKSCGTRYEVRKMGPCE